MEFWVDFHYEILTPQEKSIMGLWCYAESHFYGQSHSSYRGDLSSQQSKVTSYKVGWGQFKCINLKNILETN